MLVLTPPAYYSLIAIYRVDNLSDLGNKNSVPATLIESDSEFSFSMHSRARLVLTPLSRSASLRRILRTNPNLVERARAATVINITRDELPLLDLENGGTLS